MPDIPISYGTARATCQTGEVMVKLRASKSREKNARPSELTWSFRWYLRVESLSFGDLVHGKRSSPSTLDDVSTDLCARKGRWFGSVAMVVNPMEVREAFAANEKRKAELWQKPVSAEEYQKAIEALQKQKNGGFWIVGAYGDGEDDR